MRNARQNVAMQLSDVANDLHILYQHNVSTKMLTSYSG